MNSLFSFIFCVAQAVYSLTSRIIIFFSLKVQKFIFNLTRGICGIVLFIIISKLSYLWGDLLTQKMTVTFLLNISFLDILIR